MNTICRKTFRCMENNGEKSTYQSRKKKERERGSYVRGERGTYYLGERIGRGGRWLERTEKKLSYFKENG